MSEYITLKQLSSEIGVDKSNLRKYILASGFTIVKIRDKTRQLVMAVTTEEAVAIVERRTGEGYGVNGNGVRIDSGIGFFYIIQLVPELDPRRVKLGFTNNVDRRLVTHRTACPYAQVVAAYPCKQVWEFAAMDSITRQGCKLVASEVFECDDISALVEIANKFFENMPDPAFRVELSIPPA